MFLFLITFSIFLKASFAMPIRILISASFLPSDVIVLPRYLNFSTCLMVSFVNVNVTCGGDCFCANDHTLRLFYFD